MIIFAFWVSGEDVVDSFLFSSTCSCQERSAGGGADESDKGRKGVSLNEYLPVLRNAPCFHGPHFEENPA